MSRTPTIFGISMVSKTRRRWLVIFSYMALCILILLFYFSMSGVARYVLMICVIMAANSVQFGIFYILAKDTVLPIPVQEGMRPINLSLSRSIRSERIKPDERQVAVRNAAYYKAYRVVAASVLIIPILFLGLMTSDRMLFAASVLSIYGVIYTLPQAIILWTEPDMPEEAT